MAKPLTQRYKRWYEINPIIKDAIAAWEYFPPALQHALAQYVAGLFKTKALTCQYASLSRTVPAQIVRFCNHRQRRRWYDTDDTVRAMMNRLAFVAHDDLIWLAEKIIQLRHTVHQREIKAETLSADKLAQLVEETFTQKRYAV